MTAIASPNGEHNGGGAVGALATTAVPVLDAAEPVAGALARLQGEAFRSAAHLAVMDADGLAGVLTIEEVLAADREEPVGRLIRDRATVVAPETDPEVAVWAMARDHHTTIAVVDHDDRFCGLVPHAAVLAVLEREHEEDLARLGGYLHTAERARTASTEPVHRRLWHRLPWLLIGLLAAMLAAGVVSGSEDALSRDIALAFFLPGIVYLADAVGTQTETVVIRGLSVGVGVRQVVWRETATGLLIGLVLSAIVLPVAWLWYGRPLAVTVAVALLAAASIATAVALVLPSALSRLDIDPAFGSGPLATVTQDLLTIAIYFTCARLFLG